MRSLFRVRFFPLSVLGGAAAAVGCSYDHTSTLPSAQQTTPAASNPSTGSGGAFLGTWSSTQAGSAPR